MSSPLVLRALLSVSDKTGLIELAHSLHKMGVQLISTGGTAKTIAAESIPVLEVSEVTEFPEIMDGRVKTLHPKIHGALLGVHDKASHKEAMTQYDIQSIELLVVNLYPFEKTVQQGSDFNRCIENIDIGGPAMIRSAAKNHNSVAVVVSPTDYQTVIKDLEDNKGRFSDNLRKQLAHKAFTRTASYDAAISNWFLSHSDEFLPDTLLISARRKLELRYGENPHQSAAFYSRPGLEQGVSSAKQVQGKDLSYNNINDTDAALELVLEFEEPAVAIVKHANPCGVAIGDNCFEAYSKALACDPISAFGGVVAVNKSIDKKLAEEIIKLFTEVVIAPFASDEALTVFRSKKNLRLLLIGDCMDLDDTSIVIKPIGNGFLAQTKDQGFVPVSEFKVVTEKLPTTLQLSDLSFAAVVAKHVKSNAIVYVKNGATVGIGAGQMSRLDSARIAASKAADVAGETTPATFGSVVASDAFFPFADGLLAVIEAGATAVVQPGGSMRDAEVIDAANEKGVAMVFTGKRHFRH